MHFPLKTPLFLSKRLHLELTSNDLERFPTKELTKIWDDYKKQGILCRTSVRFCIVHLRVNPEYDFRSSTQQAL